MIKYILNYALNAIKHILYLFFNKIFNGIAQIKYPKHRNLDNFVVNDHIIAVSP